MLGLTSSGQLSGPECPQVLTWQRVGMVEAGSDTGTRGSWLRTGGPRAAYEGRGAGVLWLGPGHRSTGPYPGAQGHVKDALPGRLPLCSCLSAPRAAHSLSRAAWALGSCFPRRLSSTPIPSDLPLQVSLAVFSNSLLLHFILNIGFWA